jgi:hypothetical protein
MPVTVTIAPEKVGQNRDRTVSITDPPATLYTQTRRGCEDPYKTDPLKPANAQRNLLSSSFRDPSTKLPAQIIPYQNGFVNGILRAFNQDLHLTIRPEDVWLAILVQFNFYVNGNAEMLREVFVTHEGKKTLTVDVTPFKVDFSKMGEVAQTFTGLIEENIVDKGLREWMTPGFSTTTDNDRAVAAFVMMGAMKSYFEYSFLCGCGFPSVTLVGERSDWEELQSRVERLPKYGTEPTEWATLLRPIMRWFVKTFDEPTSPEVHKFWLRVAHEAGVEGSGMGLTTLSGWLTAFSFWDEKGKRVHSYTDEEAASRDRHRFGRNSLPATDRKRLVLDGVSYPLIRPATIAKGVMTVPVKIRDYSIGMDRFTTALAGSVGMALSASGSEVQPVSAWWLVEEFQKPIDGPGLVGPQAPSTVGGSTTDGGYSASESDDCIT